MGYLCKECVTLGWTCDASSDSGASAHPGRRCSRHPDHEMRPEQDVLEAVLIEREMQRRAGPSLFRSLLPFAAFGAAMADLRFVRGPSADFNVGRSEDVISEERRRKRAERAARRIADEERRVLKAKRKRERRCTESTPNG